MRPLQSIALNPWALLAAVPWIQLAWADSSSQKPLRGEKPSPFTSEFDNLVDQTLERWHVPGLAIAVVDGDATWAEGYGMATFPSTSVTPDTLFMGGSTTKAFVAAALSLMIESKNFTLPSPLAGANPRQTLDWSTPISTILRDDFVLADQWATDHITIQDALSHRTGLPRHDLARSRSYDGQPGTVKGITRSLRHLPMTAEPRVAFQYCNLMFNVLSHVIETLSGRWLGHVLKDWIWAPLGMNSTYFDLDDALSAPEHYAAGYYWDNQTQEYVQVPYMPLLEVSGAGAVISTVNDYAKWLRCLIYETKPLSKAGLEHIKAPRIFPGASASWFDTPPAYASGWATMSYKGRRLWSHSGGTNAYGAEVYFFPDLEYGIVTFGNTAVTSNGVGEVLAWHLVDEKLGIPKDQRHDRNDDLEKSLARIAGRIDSALDDAYPDRANPPLPPALDLEKYTGVYSHPGYENLTLRLNQGQEDSSGEKGNPIKFVAERKGHTWPVICEFVHVSSEYWIMYVDMLYERSGNFRDYAPAEFVVGADGKVASLIVKIGYQPTGEVEGVIRFDKIE